MTAVTTWLCDICSQWSQFSYFIGIGPRDTIWLYSWGGGGAPRKRVRSRVRLTLETITAFQTKYVISYPISDPSHNSISLIIWSIKNWWGGKCTQLSIMLGYFVDPTLSSRRNQNSAENRIGVFYLIILLRLHAKGPIRKRFVNSGITWRINPQNIVPSFNF